MATQESCCLRSPFCIEFLHFAIFWALHISIHSPTQMALVVTGFLRSDVHPNLWTQYQTARSPSGQSWLPQRLSASWQTKTVHWGLHPCRFQSQTPSKSNNSRALVAAATQHNPTQGRRTCRVWRAPNRHPSWPIRNPNALAPELRICHAWRLDQTLTEWPMVTRVQMLSDLGKSWEMSPVLVKAVGQTPRKKSLLSYPWISASQTSPSTAMLSSSNFSRSERKSCKKAAASSLEQVIFSWGSARKSETQQVLQTPWGWVHSTSQR